MAAFLLSAATSFAAFSAPDASHHHWPKKLEPEVIIVFSSYWKRKSTFLRSLSSMSATRDWMRSYISVEKS